MDPTEKDVQHHYENFPFPSGGTPHLTQHWTNLLQNFFKEEKIDPKGGFFLDAGCGTGDNVLFFAEEFPDLKFTGIDLSSNSILRANHKLQKRKFPNLHFQNKAILDYQSEHLFDFISCLGVLHHCQDPEKNLSHLINLLKPRGYLFLDVYGYFGYLTVERTQKAINLLQPDFSKLNERKNIMEWIVSEFLGLIVPSDSTDSGYIGLADGFLVPIAHSYQISKIISRLNDFGVTDICWWDCPKIDNGMIHYQNFRGQKYKKSIPKAWEQRLLSLSQLSRYSFFELCFAPFDYFLIGKKQA